MDMRPRIGLFDSGIGGMSVLCACLRLRPDAAYFYYGDNLRAPYGSRTEQEISAYTREAMRQFEAIGVDTAVIACNTATAVCIEQMRAEFSFPVIGVEPAVKTAADACSHVLVLATPVTARSARLRQLIKRFPAVDFTVWAAPKLAEAVEAHFLHGERLDLSEHLPQRFDCDGAVLGCTHYSLIRRQIAHFLGVPTFDGAEGTARHVFELIELGMSDHLQPRTDANNCLTSECNKRVVFLGSGRFLNKNLFDLNICFSCI